MPTLILTAVRQQETVIKSNSVLTDGNIANSAHVLIALCYLPGIRDIGGRAKVSTFFVTSYLFISAAFRATIAIKVCKLIDMIRKIDLRTLEVRARGNRTLAQLILKNMQKSPYHGVALLARSARTSARKIF